MTKGAQDIDELHKGGILGTFKSLTISNGLAAYFVQNRLQVGVISLLEKHALKKLERMR